MGTVVIEIKQSKHYLVIFFFIPNVSPQEQMSVIRTVKIDKASEIKEYFMGFPVASKTTDLDLS